MAVPSYSPQLLTNLMKVVDDGNDGNR